MGRRGEAALEAAAIVAGLNDGQAAALMAGLNEPGGREQLAQLLIYFYLLSAEQRDALVARLRCEAGLKMA